MVKVLLLIVFELLNTETQDVKEIWKYTAETFFVDSKKQIVILSPSGRIYLETEPEIGIYVVSFDGDYHKVSDEFVYFIDGQEAVNQYIASDEQHQLVSVKLDGSITHLARRADYYVPPRSSPDGKWIIITSETRTELYSKDLQLMKPLGIHATDIVWRPTWQVFSCIVIPYFIIYQLMAKSQNSEKSAHQKIVDLMSMSGSPKKQVTLKA